MLFLYKGTKNSRPVAKELCPMLIFSFIHGDNLRHVCFLDMAFAGPDNVFQNLLLPVTVHLERY